MTACRAKILGVSAAASLLLATGCAGVAITLLGVGSGVAASTAINYTLDGIAYRTFTASLSVTRTAALTALDRMGIEIQRQRKNGEEEIIRARAVDRRIEVGLEVLSDKTTRISTVAKHGLLYLFRDRATATEIIIQTEKAIEELNGEKKKSGAT